MTEDQVRALLLRRAKPFAVNKGTTGVRNWCEAHGVINTHVSDFLLGKRRAPNDLIEALGLEYRIVRKRRPS